MISRQEKERQLIESGMFDSIKAIFIKNNIQISDKYLMLITDYIDTLGQLDYENGLYLDPIKVAQELPKLLKSVKEEQLGVYGVTDNLTITMNSRNDYETNKALNELQIISDPDSQTDIERNDSLVSNDGYII